MNPKQAEHFDLTEKIYKAKYAMAKNNMLLTYEESQEEIENLHRRILLLERKLIRYSLRLKELEEKLFV